MNDGGDGEYSFWDAFKELPGIMWGDSWTGIDSMGRWLCIGIGLLLLAIIVGAIWSWIGDLRFAASCRRRGGHVHVTYRDHGPGVGVIVGNVVVPTRNTSKTLRFAKGKEENCQKCSGGR